MRKIYSIAAIAALALTAASCNKENGGAAARQFVKNNSEVCLKVNGKMAYSFDPDHGQLGYNSSLNEFRASNDDMSEFFILTFKEAPAREGQTVQASAEWTSAGAVQSNNSITFSVSKIESDGTIWLYSGKSKIGAVVRKLQ
ncbi:MAG: hypothetical protein IJM35_10245 [Bacteroidales bacterium]|nr:hypothetical protein [Bacteroidales bacterium]